MKKINVWLMLGTLVIILPLVFACGGATTPPAQTPVTPPAQTPVTPPAQTSEVPPAQTPAATPPAQTPVTPPVALATAIPHTVEGRAACLMCHETGVVGAKAVPASHAGRTNDLCQTCHKPAS